MACRSSPERRAGCQSQSHAPRPPRRCRGTRFRSPRYRRAAVPWRSKSGAATTPWRSRCVTLALASRPTFWRRSARHSSPHASMARGSGSPSRARRSCSTEERYSTPAPWAEAPRRSESCRLRRETMARLLLVDDDPAMLFALKELAESNRHEAVLAPSGAEALALLDGVDAVVTDYAMPAMDGVQLLKSIRDRDESLPVILLTAHGSERIAVRAMKAGAYENVNKPFEL